MITKNINFLFLFIIYHAVGFEKSVWCMRNNLQPEKVKTYVYCHGFGEDGPNPLVGPTFPDAPGRIFHACFYTKPAVHQLADHLIKRIREGADTFNLTGISCGAGTAINCLAQLINYEKNPGYFDGTDIKTKNDAERIIEAINKRSLMFTVPFLSLKKSLAVSTSSQYLAPSSIVATCVTAYRWGIFDRIIEMMGYSPTLLKRFTGFFAACIAASSILGPLLKNMWATIIDTVIVPCVTRFHYNPFHPKPINVVEILRGKIRCPVLMHFCMNEDILEKPDEDTIKFYDALRTDNERKTHIILDYDGSHNSSLASFRKAECEFVKKYINSDEDCFDFEETFLNTQPTIEELRNKIFSPTNQKKTIHD